VRELPPSIHLLLEEAERLRNPLALPGLLSDVGFQKDLRAQVNATIESWKYPSSRSSSPREFVVSLGSTANPLASALKCADAACRRQLVQVMARTSCIYADRVVLPDAVTAMLSSYLQTPEPEGLEAVLGAFAALREMRPLINADIVTLSAPPRPPCPNCDRELLDAVASAVEQLCADFVASITGAVLKPTAKPNEFMLSLASPLLENDGFPIGFGPVVGLENGPTDAVAISADEARQVLEQVGPDGLRDFIENELLTVCVDIRGSAEGKGTLSTNFRLAALGLRALQKKPIRHDSLEEFERMRSLRLPWFEYLNPEDVLRLRERAASALPAFRAHIGTAIGGSDDRAVDDSALAKVVADLRKQTQEVETELKAAATSKGAIKTAVLTGLSLSVGLFGVYQGLSGQIPQAVTAVGAALGALAAADRRLSDAKACHQKLEAHPGYLLLMAERIEEHAHGNR